ncbi:aldose 1-epimerase [Leeuwenhoekiella aestuarii]|uniref:Aldose 1-epimerase n=2 Tax=Leeuwenhoekiella aestuarii TaxID=2249426 RepID=A0A4Q0NZD4_9FLAO|nr:aldose epimerase family protein [Leeuwenhoekiella aestuarii]RXG18320.1 aldose 1-epimerase [Leeuwenhoekiella aestuarii]RXG19625.1 aldose 1-epimerase [Leeuwenhoekiella aestuarii]
MHINLTANLCTRLCLFLVLGISFSSCKETTAQQNEHQPPQEMTLNEQAFKSSIAGKKTALYWIKNEHIEVAFTNYGGRIVGLWVPDKNGKMTDVVVGMGSVQDFANATEPYFGATIGRVGNRIANGAFRLDGKDYQVPTNNGDNALHGGDQGFQYKVWDARQPDAQTLILNYRSPDMEMGFPGNVAVTVTYSVTTDRELLMEYEATTDQKTLVNLTNHAFFNLNGEGSGSILDHNLMIDAGQYTPVDAGLIPTGKLDSVAGTPFDFTTPHTIGERIETPNEQLTFGKGYDHNYVLNETDSEDLHKAAVITGDASGITMEVRTKEPGLQFYSGNFMEGKNTFKSGATDDFRTAFALETQHFPDAPNQPDFPSIVLNPDEKYETVSIYKFSVTN